MRESQVALVVTSGIDAKQNNEAVTIYVSPSLEMMQDLCVYLQLKS